MDKRFDRRALLRYAAGGAALGLTLEQLGGVPLVGTWTAELLQRLGSPINRYDSYAMMANALRGGPALLGVAKAMAAQDGWTLVQIKVLNHVYTPLLFKLGKQTDSGVETSAGVPLASARALEAKPMLIGQGVDVISDNPRYAALRFNKWFANMLHNGTKDGAAAGSNLLGLASTDVAPLSSEKVAVQAFLGLGQIDANNHALKGCKLRASLPDLTLFCAEKNLIDSPLGISCFMMGDTYDRAEGATPTNAVLGASDSTESSIVTSRTVAAYVSQISQYVGKTYADRAPIEQNITFRLDQLVQKDPVLRRDLVNSIVQFQSGLGALTECASLEATSQALDKATGNSQAARDSREVGARSEFLAQCKYVAVSTDLPGTPVRNYSLFLNATDLDGNNYDRASEGGGGDRGVRALSYVEAMRQLAMGLNILGKQIAAGKRMIVVVHSEGGRDSSMGDSKTGFALVMGPRGAGMLDDGLFWNKTMLNADTNSVLIDPGLPASAIPWDMDGLYLANGKPADGRKPTTGDVQMGVVEFLEEKTGVNARQGLSGADGAFVKLKRFG